MSGMSEQLQHLLHQQAAALEAQMKALQQAIAAERARLDQTHIHTADVEQHLSAQRSLVGQVEAALRQADQTSSLLSEAIQLRVRALENEAGERQRGRRARIQELTDQVRARLQELDKTTEQIGTLAPDDAMPRENASGNRADSPTYIPTYIRTYSPTHSPTQSLVHDLRMDSSMTSDPSRSQPDASAAAVAPPTPAQPITAKPALAQVEAGLRNRISTNVVRLLEGKVVGEDLRDADGAVMATRGTAITPELAARAEAAGVLPDLILHMVWPEEVRS